MVSQKVVVKNPSGLHARPAAVLAQAAMQCDSSVMIVGGENKINIKSVLNIMAACIRSGTEIEVQCDGATEQEDLAAITALIENGLGE